MDHQDFKLPLFNGSFFVFLTLTGGRYSFTIIISNEEAGVAELADAPDLGSGGLSVQVQILSPAPVNLAGTAREPVFFVNVTVKEGENFEGRWNTCCHKSESVAFFVGRSFYQPGCRLVIIFGRTGEIPCRRSAFSPRPVLFKTSVSVFHSPAERGPYPQRGRSQ